MTTPFTLKHTVLVVALAAIYPMQSAAAVSAGVAQFIAGDVNVRRSDGGTAPLAKGKDIESGEAILTGTNGRAQVKFSDGGLISLQPNTEFKIANYVDQADPKTDRFLVDLLRGSMRAITGLIGKRNRENYKVTTTTATIGIRGSGFNVGYNPDGTLGVTTELDAIEVCTAAGCVGLTAGESVRVINATDLPVRTNTRATIATPPPSAEVQVVGNQVDKTGKNALLPTITPVVVPTVTPAVVPKVLTGVAFTGYGLTSSAFVHPSSGNGALTVGNSSSAALPVSFANGEIPGESATLSGTGTLVASGGSLATGDYFALGTWSSSIFVTGVSQMAVGPLAFVTGVPTPTTVLASLSGQRATYSFSNATPVFSSITGPGTLLPSSNLTVDFSGAGNFVNVNLDVSMPSATYNLRGGVSTKVGQNGFKGQLAVSGPSCLGAPSFCGVGTVDGGFISPNAANAALSFGAYSLVNGFFGGAAIFAKTAQALTPSNSSFTDLRASVMDGSAIITQHEYASSLPSTTVTPTFSGNKLVTLVDNTQYSGVLTLQEASPSTGSYGALGAVSDADFLGWGTWVTGSKNYAPAYGAPTSAMLDSVHYVVGRPTPNAQMPLSGAANYAMVGGTAPTATLGGVTQTGQLVSATLSANFGVGSATANIATQFGAVPVTISQSASFTPGTANFSGASTSTAVSGFFTGNQAIRAGLVYSTTNGAIGQVTGAAAFQRSN